jgi:hypothetical protein
MVLQQRVRVIHTMQYEQEFGKWHTMASWSEVGFIWVSTVEEPLRLAVDFHDSESEKRGGVERKGGL